MSERERMRRVMVIRQAEFGVRLRIFIKKVKTKGIIALFLLFGKILSNFAKKLKCWNR
jgi:hypothetical protein